MAQPVKYTDIEVGQSFIRTTMKDGKNAVTLIAPPEVGDDGTVLLYCIDPRGVDVVLEIAPDELRTARYFITDAPPTAEAPSEDEDAAPAPAPKAAKPKPTPKAESEDPDRAEVKRISAALGRAVLRGKAFDNLKEALDAGDDLTPEEFTEHLKRYGCRVEKSPGAGKLVVKLPEGLDDHEDIDGWLGMVVGDSKNEMGEEALTPPEEPSEEEIPVSDIRDINSREGIYRVHLCAATAALELWRLIQGGETDETEPTVKATVEIMLSELINPKRVEPAFGDLKSVVGTITPPFVEKLLEALWCQVETDGSYGFPDFFDPRSIDASTWVDAVEAAPEDTTPVVSGGKEDEADAPAEEKASSDTEPDLGELFVEFLIGVYELSGSILNRLGVFDEK